MKLFKDIRYISLLGLFLGVFLMNLFVVNSGDDFFYAAFSNSGVGRFISAHIDHYVNINGRSIVHILDSIFLWLPHIIWKIVNPLMWVAIVMNIYRLINIYVKDRAKLRLVMFMLCGAFLTIHIEMAKESTLWMTGSFNYTYPLMMFTWYWYLLFTNEKQSLRKLCVVGFFAAASMEQESALALMLAAGVAAYSVLIRKQELSQKLKRALVFTAIGTVSLFLAPGNLSRMGDEISRSGGTVDNIFSGIDFMLNYCISSNYMLWITIVLMVCCAAYLFRHGIRWFAYILPAQIAVLFITNHSGNFEWMGIVYGIIFHASRVYYFAALAISVYVYYIKEKCILPALCAGFGIFSCAFIVFSPTLGARVILFAEVMAIMITVMLMLKLLKKRTMLYAGVHLIVLALSTWNVAYITHGFYKNSVVYKENVQLIEEWHKTNRGDLIQKQYRNDKFEHSMPYNSEYHDKRYKEFFDIPTRINIIWE